MIIQKFFRWKNGIYLLNLAVSFSNSHPTFITYRGYMDKKELKSHKRKIKTDIENMQAKLATLKTNHILHLILSIITAGLWLVVWLLVSHFNTRGRITLEKKIRESREVLDDIEDQIDDLD